VIRFAAVAAAAVLALPLIPAAAIAKPAAPVAHDWVRTVVATPQGGFRMGNPAAPVRLIEYGSLACPHCRHFEETGFRPLTQSYVRSGKVSYEFRNLLINGPDLAVTLVARCGGAAKFFPISQLVYATQPKWEQKFASLSDADKAVLDKMPVDQRIVRFAQIGGFVQLAARFGVTPAQARRCVSDRAALKRLLETVKAANDAGIHSTPTFLINGKVTDATTWEDLEPLLKSAIRGRG
jgi:protein-disulfide isomerase